NGDGIVENLFGSAIAVLVLGELLLVEVQLAQEALAQVAASDTGRIHLANQFYGLVKLLEVKAYWGYRWNWSRGRPGLDRWRLRGSRNCSCRIGIAFRGGRAG